MIKEILQEIEAQEEAEWDDAVRCVSALRDEYPNDVYEDRVNQVVSSLLHRMTLHLEKIKSKYNSLASFKEKKEYYDDVIQPSILAMEKYKTLFKPPLKPKPYETWVTPSVYRFIKEVGFDKAIELYIVLNKIL